MTVESTTQALCDLALRFGEGDEESMVSIFLLIVVNLFNLCFDGNMFHPVFSGRHFLCVLCLYAVSTIWSIPSNCWS